MPKLFDRVKFNTSTTGTGDIAIGSAASGAFYLPSDVGAADGDTVRYIIGDGTDVEEGVGTLADSAATMERTTVTISKIGGVVGTTKLDLSGTAVVALTGGAFDIVNQANNLSDLEDVATARGNLGLGTAAVRADTDFPRTDTAQSLTDAQKAQARSNLFKGPTTQVFTSGSGTYTTPDDCLWIEVELIGGGGGGAGSGTSAGAGGTGGNSTFGTSLLTGHGGSGALNSAGGAGGTATGGFINRTGGMGSNGSGLTSATPGGSGSNSPYGGGGSGGAPGAGAGVAAAANTGSGGGGGGVNATPNGGGGGGAGGFVRAIINSPDATYSYAVGAAGSAGTAGSSGAAGGAGGSGFIQVTEHYV